ncbi:MAG: Ureidoglycolate lyase [Vezdaea aestivalis]|nr:MAG: Ureidoglycolate lyase [Vezdaea aestivalis]
MPPQLTTPQRLLTLEHLTPTSFSAFGTVSSHSATPQITNQGTASKHVLAPPQNHYNLARSRKPSSPAFSLYVSRPRSTLSGPHPGLQIPILERHPYTTQTFTPTGVAASDTSRAYIVVVAPTLPPNRSTRPPPFPEPLDTKKKGSWRRVFGRARPPPFPISALTADSSSGESGPDSSDGVEYELARPRGTSSSSSMGQTRPRGVGLPDLANARAFLAGPGQSVTYGAGTWHSPMVVVGGEIEFVVFQFANGVAVEDCQEVEIKGEEGGEGLGVDLGLWVERGVDVKARF